MMKRKKSLTISNSKELCEVPFSDITFIMSNGMSATIHTLKEKFYVSKNIGAIENELDNTFYRPTNSHLISRNGIVKYLKEDGGIILMKCGSKITPSRSKKSGFIKWYKEM